MGVHRHLRLTLSKTEILISPSRGLLPVLFTFSWFYHLPHCSGQKPSHHLFHSPHCVYWQIQLLGTSKSPKKPAYFAPSPLSPHFCPGGTPFSLVFTFTSQPTISPTAVTNWTFHWGGKIQPLFQSLKTPNPSCQVPQLRVPFLPLLLQLCGFISVPRTC